MNGSILIVEDDTDIAQLVATYLRREGFATEEVETGEAAIEAIAAQQPDLIVLDINLPGMDGFEVLQNVRREATIPVIVLTARQEEMDAVFGLGAGADEYVTKPFSPRVLAARVRALLRRVGEGAGPRGDKPAGRAGGATAGATEDPPRRIPLGDVEVDLDTARVHHSGLDAREQQPVTLAPRELALLRFLFERDGTPASSAEIYEAVWGKAYGDLSSVAVHIQRLRRKLEADPGKPRYLVTRHGYGYALELTPSENDR
ncbi:MAG: response regulator transcription factor [Spirochaetaceae bacterium]